MSKYKLLWEYVCQRNEESITLSFLEIKNILGFDIDHSFLNYKKELLSLGFEVKKISLKEKTIIFQKIRKEV